MTSDFRKLLCAGLGSPNSEVRSPHLLDVRILMSEVLLPRRINTVKGIAP